MNIILLYLIVISCVSLLYIGFSDDAEARHQGGLGGEPIDFSKKCTVNISPVYSSPVTYNNNTRENPDASLYPGDAIHFIFKFRGLNTCTSFSVEPLVGSGDMVFKSALVIYNGTQNPRPHNIILYEWMPKFLTTKHYYVDTIRYEKCGSERCKVVIEAESPRYSLRQDEIASGSLQRLIDNAGTASTYSLRIGITQTWHLAQDKAPYRIGVDEHVLEDRESVDRFINHVKDNCSDLPKYGGCVFGHIEIDTDAGTEKQMCLFEELDKRGIHYNETTEDIYAHDGVPSKNNPRVIYAIDHRTIVTDECILIKSETDISISVEGTGLSCNNEGKCESYTRTDNSSIAPNILYPYGDVFFEYPHLYDPDGFPGKNNDGTYYLDNPIGIHGIPDARFKESRSGIITFDGTISSNPIHMIDFVSCDKMCNAALSGQKMSDITHVIENGDMLSAHYASEYLGIAKIKHITKMYNINRLIGEYSGTATPLIVVYKPQIIHVDTWSRLADGGYLSFHNRYAIAINYAGSLGGGPDDGDSTTIHPDRSVKITDISGIYFMTNPFGKESLDWNPDGVVSGAHGLGDLSVHESVYRYIPQNYTFVDTFENPAIVLWNGTISDIMVQSAGYARILKGVEIPEEKLDTYNINVTAYDTLSTQNYGGITVDHLISSKYNFPWGYFSTPLNVTAYYISANMTSYQDTDVIINHIHATDATDATVDSEFISTVEFYLNQHDSAEFEYMHMADMYEMNPRVSLSDAGTSVIQLNKTGIYYDIRAYNKAVSNKFLGETFTELTSKDILNASRRDFFTSPSHYDVMISASRDGITRNNTIQMGGVELSNVIKYKLNMHPQNSLFVNKVDDTAMVPRNLYFGDISQLSVNGEPYDRVACGDGCLVLLEDDSSAEFSVENAWGGVATATNVTGVILHDYDPDLWIEDTPMRIFWFVMGLGLLYGGYRGIKILYKSRRE